MMLGSRRTPRLHMRVGALVYFYRRRLRVHGAQEALAGVGVALGVALVLASTIAAASLAGSAGEVVHAVIGPATLQLHARGPDGIDQRLLARVEKIPGVRQAAPLLEQTATLTAGGAGTTGAGARGADEASGGRSGGARATGRSVTVDLAGADTSLVVLDGLAHTLPRATLQAGGIGLSRTSAAALGIASRAAGPAVTLRLRGSALALRVSAVLGPEAFGALAQARVAVMPLADLQRLAGLRGRVSRILVEPLPGREGVVRAGLERLAAGRIDVVAADRDVALLRQALGPSDQASSFFATISGLLGLLLAFTALLLTVPERRRAVADLRLSGARRGAIVQMFAFQAACLGVLASLAGIAAGWGLARSAFQPSTGYLAEAFTLGARTPLGLWPALIALLGGVGATFLASSLPLLDLRRGRALDAVYRDRAVPGNALPRGARRALRLGAAALLATATALLALAPSLALLACALLALATVLAVPLAFAAVLRGAQLLAERRRLSLLTVALSSLRATTVRSLALAATGALALFGSVALGGARADLLRGIQTFAHAYSSDAPVWIGSPTDNQAVVDFSAATPPFAHNIPPYTPLAHKDAHTLPAKHTTTAPLTDLLARLPGVARVATLHGGFVELSGRRVWLLARPAGSDERVLASQITSDGGARLAAARLAAGGWVVASRQLAAAQHVAAGQTFALPTPSGVAHLRLAATTTNLAWSPGAVFVGAGDYRRLWGTGHPTALALYPRAGVAPAALRRRVQTALAALGPGPAGGLEVLTASEREARIDSLTGEGLGQLGEISDLLLAIAILALAAALGSAIWQRRPGLAGLRLSGVRPRRLRAILLIEAALMLGAGCLTGALVGLYGQLTIDRYLTRVTGFPVASMHATLRPVELLALIAGCVLALVAAPAWTASHVSPTFAFEE